VLRFVSRLLNQDWIGLEQVRWDRSRAYRTIMLLEAKLAKSVAVMSKRLSRQHEHTLNMSTSAPTAKNRVTLSKAVRQNAGL